MIKGTSDKCFNCGESSHFIKDCIEFLIQDYLKNINNENIHNETIKINSIYEEFVELNRLIKLTDFICIDDLPEIKKVSEDMKKLNKLQEQNNKLHAQNRKNKEEKSYNIREKLSSIGHQLNELNYLKIRNNWKQQIHTTYQQINSQQINKIQDNLNKDIVILGLELIKFNLEKKKRLKEIEKYYSEDFIKELLSKLYEKEIEIIKSQIS